jgi:hypothetical protein
MLPHKSPDFPEGARSPFIPIASRANAVRFEVRTHAAIEEPALVIQAQVSVLFDPPRSVNGTRLWN